MVREQFALNGYGMWGKQESVYNFAVECGYLVDPIGCADNIKMDLREFGCEDGKWMDLIRIMSNGRLFMTAVMKL